MKIDLNKKSPNNTWKIQLEIPDPKSCWPLDAYLLVGLIPRDSRSRFREPNSLTDYIAMFSSSFFKFHDPKKATKILVNLQSNHINNNSLEIFHEARFHGSTTKRASSPLKRTGSPLRAASSASINGEIHR